MTYARLLIVCALALALAACSERSTPSPADGGDARDLGTTDANVPDGAVALDASDEDAASPLDAATPTDGATPDSATPLDGGPRDSGVPIDMCRAPRCPPIPVGCDVVPSVDPCVCGEIVCDDGGVASASCGGRAGPCDPGFYCDFAVPFDCGLSDGMGTCRPAPEVCGGVFAPVCGCDGATYSNACEANSAGVDYAAEGECATEPPPPPPVGDCRVTGCPRGQSCQACRGPGGAVNVCIPDGAVC